MNTAQKPTLLGFIIDVSISMKRSWKNRDGQKLPRIQVIRDVLNQQIRNAALTKNKADQTPPIEIFALGMGFRRIFRWTGAEMTYGREKRLQGKVNETIDLGVVCDVLALAEMLPSTQDFQKLSKSVNEKWNQYVAKLIDQTKIDNDIENQLHEFLHIAFHDKALRRFRLSFSFPLLKFFQVIQKYVKLNFISSTALSLRQSLNNKEQSIVQKSQTISNSFFSNIIEKTKSYFDGEREEFKNYIENTIEEFVTKQCILLSDLIALGYSVDSLVNAIDETTANKLAHEIYDYLSHHIKQNIVTAWEVNSIQLFLEAAGAGIRIDQQTLKALTEKCIQKHSWDYLKPFIEATMTSIFTKTFDKIAKGNLSAWVNFATHREVIRSLEDISIILPDSINHSLYTEAIMFGGTPIEEAIKLASLRFLDRKFSNYNKVLIIISDGKFETDASIMPAKKLQESGVSIIGCYVTERDIVLELPSKRMSRWPQGAKFMYEISSFYKDEDFISKTLKERGYKAKEGVKLFCQINHSEILGEIADAVLSPKD